MTLTIGDEELESHIGIVGKTGSGKSNTAKVIAERLMHDKRRVCILDPTGTWWGLRLMPNGKPSPFKPVIFGGAHCDLPIAEQHGAVLGEAIGTSSDSAIIDTRLMTVGQRTRFAAAFAETLLRTNKGPLHLIIDEAHLFAPQGRVNDPQSGAMLHAFNNLVSLGRGIGLRIVLISQRPAKLHKDSLTQVETLIAMRLIAPQDRAAINDWVGEWATSGEERKSLMSDLPSMKTGEAWVWAPQLDYLNKGKFPLAITYDSGRAPSGEEVAPDLVALDTIALGDKMDAIRQEAMENDPKRLKARIAELEREIKAKPAAVDPAMAQREYQRGRGDGYDQGFEIGYAEGKASEANILGQMVVKFAGEVAASIQNRADEKPSNQRTKNNVPVDEPQASYTPPQIVTKRIGPAPKIVVQANGEMSPSSRKVVEAVIAAYPIGLTLVAAAKRAGLSRRSSAFNRYLKEAAADPRIQDRGDGRYVALAGDSSVSAPRGLDAFKASLPPSYANMLSAIQESGNVLSREEIAEKAGVSPTSSGLGAGIRELLALELIVADGAGYRLSPDFTSY